MRNPTLWLALPAAALGAAMASALIGCGPSVDSEGVPPAPVDAPPPRNPLGSGPARALYAGGAVTNGGTISGTVKFSGGGYTPAKLEFTKDVEGCGAKEAVDPKLLVDGATQGVANVVVYLHKVKQGKAWGDGATIDNQGCMFKPYIVLHPYTKKMNIKNSDPVTHNTNLTKSKNDGINPLLDQGATDEWSVSKAEKRPFRVGCDVHGWMEAWVWVIDHPYYVRSAADGSFSLTDVPAGDYELRAWHPLKNAIVNGPKVTVGAGATAAAGLEVTADGTVTFK
jgi:hypothetical protein